MHQEKNESEKIQTIIGNSNQEDIEDSFLQLEKTDLEIDPGFFTFDEKNEAQNINLNQEKIEDKNNALVQRDEDNKGKANQKEIEDYYNEQVKKECKLYKEMFTFNQKNDAKENNDEENKSEILEVKSTGVDSMIAEEKKSIVLKGKDNVRDIIKKSGETNNYFSSEKKALNSAVNQNQNKELNLGSSPNQPEKSSNENIIFIIPEKEKIYDSESILIGNKIKRGSESQVQNELLEEDEYNDYDIKFNKDDSLYDMINSQDNEVPESQIIKSSMTTSNRKRFNTILPNRVNESDFLTRGHVSSSRIYQKTSYTSSAFP